MNDSIGQPDRDPAKRYFEGRKMEFDTENPTDLDYQMSLAKDTLTHLNGMNLSDEDTIVIEHVNDFAHRAATDPKNLNNLSGVGREMNAGQFKEELKKFIESGGNPDVCHPNICYWQVAGKKK